MEPADAHSMQTRHPEIQRRSRRAHSYYETGTSDIRRPTDFPLQPAYRHHGRETPDQGEPRLPRRLNTHAPPRPKQRLASRHDSAAQRQPVLDGPPRLPQLHTTEMTNGPIGFIVRERSARRFRFFLGKTHKRSSGTQRVGTRCFRQENRPAVPSLKNRNHPCRRLFRQG